MCTIVAFRQLRTFGPKRFGFWGCQCNTGFKGNGLQCLDQQAIIVIIALIYFIEKGRAIQFNYYSFMNLQNVTLMRSNQGNLGLPSDALVELTVHISSNFTSFPAERLSLFLFFVSNCRCWWWSFRCCSCCGRCLISTLI